MSFLADLFRRTLPAPTLPRDNEGRFISGHRIAVRRRAIELAQSMGRTDLVSRLQPNAGEAA